MAKEKELPEYLKQFDDVDLLENVKTELKTQTDKVPKHSREKLHQLVTQFLETKGLNVTDHVEDCGDPWALEQLYKLERFIDVAANSSFETALQTEQLRSIFPQDLEENNDRYEHSLSMAMYYMAGDELDNRSPNQSYFERKVELEDSIFNDREQRGRFAPFLNNPIMPENYHNHLDNIIKARKEEIMAIRKGLQTLLPTKLQEPSLRVLACIIEFDDHTSRCPTAHELTEHVRLKFDTDVTNSRATQIMDLLYKRGFLVDAKKPTSVITSNAANGRRTSKVKYDLHEKYKLYNWPHEHLSKVGD